MQNLPEHGLIKGHQTCTLQATGNMTITRLTAYGAYWKRWSKQRTWTSKGLASRSPNAGRPARSRNNTQSAKRQPTFCLKLLGILSLSYEFLQNIPPFGRFSCRGARLRPDHELL